MYRKPQATYTVKSLSENLIIEKNALTNEGGKKYTPYGGLGYGVHYIAPKAGNYKLQIEETYNGVTKSLGTTLMRIHDVEIKEKLQKLDLNFDTMSVFQGVEYTRGDKTYNFVYKEYDNSNSKKNVVSFYRDEDKRLRILCSICDYTKAIDGCSNCNIIQFKDY